jgi:nicotinate-nucleotide adenylyltransferase
LRELRAEAPGAELLLVIGADQAEALHGWHESAAIMGLATWPWRRAARPDPAGAPLRHLAAAAGRWVAVELPNMPVSATQIRARAAAGQDIHQLVPAGVASYIALHNLYAPT